MNWVEPYFPSLIAQKGYFADIWNFLALTLLGASICAALFRRVTLLARGIFGGLAFLLVAFLPATPLWFLSGQTGVLQSEVFIVIALATFGVLAATRAIISPDLARVTTAVAAIMVSILSLCYHLILINGFDEHARSADAAELIEIIKLPQDTLTGICTLQAITCGAGYPSDNREFARDLQDWTTAARDAGRSRAILAGSLGTPSAEGTFVWAARMDEKTVQWIRRSYSNKTDALETVFFALASAAAIFWTTGGLLVEYLHRRAWRRRAKTARDGKINFRTD